MQARRMTDVHLIELAIDKTSLIHLKGRLPPRPRPAAAAILFPSSEMRGGIGSSIEGAIR